MRKAQKQKMLELIGSLYQVHEEIKKALEQNHLTLAKDMISVAQESAISLGESIEKTEGEGHITVFCIEEYCELLFCVFEGINKGDVNANKAYKTLRKQLIKIENSIKNDIVVRLEIAFFPYKASMWDSLESIYLAAKADPDCDTYCVPIPYYTLNPDQSFGEMHYEGDEYPKDIEITDWREYDFESRRPDAVYFHNPYDNCNLVTSVHPRFYSANLKKYTDILVYVPYYSTSGGMSEAQSLCPAYIYADYIVIQSPKLRKYFDADIPDRKFLPFGSPKFDKVIKKCRKPPEPSAEWKERMTGRRVYFYNTSISGMLADTETFLKKMHYVFKCFEGREDACLLWRPHPLLENTFDSMRPWYRHIYDALKRMFLDKEIGILDTTPDMTDSIALSDVYIGDAGTSVVSLFGVAGKPIFILNNDILEEPGENGWWRDIGIGFNCFEQDRFTVTQGNKLYVSEPDQYDYRYFCDLTEEKHRNQYIIVYDIDGKWYACPSDAQSILVIGKTGVEKKIELEKRVIKGKSFSFSYKYDKYLLLIPWHYPSVVRCDTETGTVSYFTENVDVFVREKNGQKIAGCSGIYHGSLYILSPVDNMAYKLDIRSGESSIVEIPVRSRCGADSFVEYEDEFWIMPNDGLTIVCWNPETNEAREYEEFPEGLLCRKPKGNVVCKEKPFGTPVRYGQYLYLPAWWSNMSLQLDLETGICKRWIPAFESEDENAAPGGKCSFLYRQEREKQDEFKIYSFSRRKFYGINLRDNACREIEVRFDLGELEKNEAGFCEGTWHLPYACAENHFNTLGRLLQERMAGNLFDRQKQLEAYRKVNIDQDGNSGQKVHDFIKKNLELIW